MNDRIVYIGPEARCWECGGLATRTSPTDPEARGCAACFPEWPALDRP